MHRATPWTGDFLVSLSALQSCRQQDLRCNLSSKALLTRPIHTESSTNGDMKSPCRAKHQCRWGDGHQHDMRRFPVCYACEPNLHIGQSAFPVLFPTCISDYRLTLFSCRESQKTCFSSTRVFVKEGGCSEWTSACLCTVTMRRQPHTQYPSQSRSLARFLHPRVFAVDSLTLVVCCWFPGVTWPCPDRSELTCRDQR